MKTKVQHVAVGLIDDSVAILQLVTERREATDAVIEHEMKRHGLKTASWVRIDPAELPADRADRNAWRLVDGKVIVCPQRKAALEARKHAPAVAASQEDGAPASLDVGPYLAAIEAASAREIDAIRQVATLAADGLRDLGQSIPTPTPIATQQTIADAMPPAPATPPVSGWIKQITERVDEDMGEAAPAVRVEMVRDEKVLTSLEEVGRAEMRYQTAIKALNGSTHAQRLIAPAAAKRDMAVLDLAKLIVAEHEELERRVMAEY